MMNFFTEKELVTIFHNSKNTHLLTEFRNLNMIKKVKVHIQNEVNMTFILTETLQFDFIVRIQHLVTSVRIHKVYSNHKLSHVRVGFGSRLNRTSLTLIKHETSQDYLSKYVDVFT